MDDQSDLDAARWRRIVAGVVGLSKPAPPRPPFSIPARSLTGAKPHFVVIDEVKVPGSDGVGEVVEIEATATPAIRRGKISLSGVPSEMEKLASTWKGKP